MTTFSLKDRVALITGASRGIGWATLVRLAQAGATVVGTATSESGAERLTAAMKEAHIEGLALVLDVTSTDAVNATIDKVMETYGRLDIVVNNAGITQDTLAMRMKDEQFLEVLDANLVGAFRVARAAMRPMMKARYGRIINMGSVVGSMGNAGQANYASAKAGLLGLTKALARELASRNITVNAIAPGFIATDMTDKLNEAQKEALQGQIPLGRLGTVDDIAAGVLYLASDEAGYVTGTTLHINGGMYTGG